MKISTTRFGDIDVDESRIIQMKGGILGFEHLKKYLLLTQNEKNPFWWFQSIDDGSAAFVVINSFMVKADYAPVISDSEVELLRIESPEDVILMSIVTISSDPVKITANLRAPVVINIKNRLARQVVLQETEYSVQYAIEASETGINKEGVKSSFLTPILVSNLAC